MQYAKVSSFRFFLKSPCNFILPIPFWPLWPYAVAKANVAAALHEYGKMCVCVVGNSLDQTIYHVNCTKSLAFLGSCTGLVRVKFLYCIGKKSYCISFRKKDFFDKLKHDSRILILSTHIPYR